MSGRPPTHVGKVMSLLTYLDSGDYFYAPVSPSVATSYAVRAGVKIRTEKVMSIEHVSGIPVIVDLTKITIV